MKSEKNQQIATVIFAQDEALVIGETVETVVKALGANDKLFVIADNCTDDTASIAAKAGANVFARPGEKASSKGDALAWFLSRYQNQLQPFSFLLVLDADTKIDPDFFKIIRANTPNGTNTPNRVAFQCFIAPLYENQSPMGKLAALSYLLDQYISDRIRTFLGWPVRLRGTGMLIKPEILYEIGNQLETKVEDIALSLLLTKKGVHIGRIDEAVVYDPIPDTAAATSRQRARWFRGQWHAIWLYRREVASLLIKGPAGWSLLSSLFLKPRWLMLTVSLFLALALSRWLWLSLFFWSYVFLGFLYVVIGLIIIPDRQVFIRASLHLPAYVWMWVRSIILSLRSSPWLKVRKKE